jgi:hypothetical protein
MEQKAENWLKFLRQYGPIPKNDNMYDEKIQKSAARAKLQPIVFEHPRQAEVLAIFRDNNEPTSVILTGTAGDGKTHLARQVWNAVRQPADDIGLNKPYQKTTFTQANGKTLTLHVIKDLSEIAPQTGMEWDPELEALLQLFCRSLFDQNITDLFLIAANDGQLIETWRKLEPTEHVLKARQMLETLLVEDLQEILDVRLKFFNLSRGSSAEMFDKALKAFLSHEGWQACSESNPGEYEAFGLNCPIRRNYELLQNPLFQKRLRSLFELCDYNDLHIALRDILLLLANAVLGHPKVKDRLMTPKDIPGIIREKTSASASIYNNIFGGNLPESRQESLDLFDYLNRFRIGHETSNKIDEILIFGGADDRLRPYFDEFLRADKFYGADDSYYAAQRQYIEGADEDESRNKAFLEMLVSQRRGFFFKIPDSQREELSLWELTVFTYAGEYLDRVVAVLEKGAKIERPILSRLVKGLNRVFVGMLINSERELYLATSLSYSHAKVSRMLEEYVNVAPRLGERIEIVAGANGIPTLNVELSQSIHCPLQLNLTRYEFLSRVAEGALPSSFSKECYEDMLAFKTLILTKLAERRQEQGSNELTTLNFKLLELDDYGNPSVKAVEVADA